MNTFECEKCGACCRVLGCPKLDPETNLCMIYESRPALCRVTDIWERIYKDVMTFEAFSQWTKEHCLKCREILKRRESMKHLLSITLVVLMLIGFSAIANADIEGITATWEQRAEDLPSVEKWNLLIRQTPDGEIIQTIEIPYAGLDSGPEFTTQETITVDGMPGTTVRRYFNMTATSKTGKTSGESNQVFVDFPIDYRDVESPTAFTVTIIVK